MPDFSSIENLKRAEEQLREPTIPPESSSNEVKEEKVERLNPDPSPASNWTFSQNWQKEILNEKQKLEKISKEIEGWQGKIQERLKIIKEIEGQSEKLNEELHKFQQKIVLIKKENETTLFQIKDNPLGRSLLGKDSPSSPTSSKNEH